MKRQDTDSLSEVHDVCFSRARRRKRQDEDNHFGFALHGSAAVLSQSSIVWMKTV
jgi:hypothetical protein